MSHPSTLQGQVPAEGEDEADLFDVPAGVEESPSLYPYQEEGAQWLSQRKYALLADDPGLGKSAQSIRAADILGLTSLLVCCPAVARLNWMREFDKFSSREWKSKRAVLAASDAWGSPDLVTVSYDLLTNKKVSTWISSRQWDVVILDESHYLSNRKAKRTEAAFAVPTARIWALSGTPAKNHAAELWPLLRRFGVVQSEYWAFVQRYCVYHGTPYGVQITGSQRIDELRSLLAPVMLRRKKDDVLKELPAISFHDVAVPASPVDIERWWPEVTIGQKSIPTFNKEIAEQQAAIDAVINVLGMGHGGVGALASLQPKTIMTRRYTGLQKTPAIAEIIHAELSANQYDKIVLFALHRDVIHHLMELLHDFHPMNLYGGTPPEKRDMYIRRFQTQKKYRVIICNIQAAGTAITLTAAHQVAFAECSWVPAENAQAAMRVHRIGQSQPVTVRFFGLADSSDEKVARVLRRKTKDLTAIFDTGTGSESSIAIDPFED